MLVPAGTGSDNALRKDTFVEVTISSGEDAGLFGSLPSSISPLSSKPSPSESTLLGLVPLVCSARLFSPSLSGSSRLSGIPFPSVSRASGFSPFLISKLVFSPSPSRSSSPSGMPSPSVSRSVGLKPSAISTSSGIPSLSKSELVAVRRRKYFSFDVASKFTRNSAPWSVGAVLTRFHVTGGTKEKASSRKKSVAVPGQRNVTVFGVVETCTDNEGTSAAKPEATHAPSRQQQTILDIAHMVRRAISIPGRPPL